MSPASRARIAGNCGNILNKNQYEGKTNPEDGILYLKFGLADPPHNKNRGRHRNNNKTIRSISVIIRHPLFLKFCISRIDISILIIYRDALTGVR